MVESNKIQILEDIALSLGLSKSTVSRALSGKGRISSKTRQSIIDYAEKSGYRPNSIASSLARQRTNNISAVIPSDALTYEMSFFHGCLMGICKAVSAAQYDVLLTVVEEDDISMLEKTVQNRKVDGFILMRALKDDLPAKLLTEKGQHFVLVGSCEDDAITQVDGDNQAAAYQLTDYMLSKHKGDLSFICGVSSYTVNQSRCNGFYLAYANAGRTPCNDLVFCDAVSRQQVLNAVDCAIAKNASAIICGDDYICRLTLERLGERNHKGMRVAAFYNDHFFESMNPIQALVDIPARDLGFQAGKKLVEIIENNASPSKSKVAHRFIFYESDGYSNENRNKA